MRIVDLDTSRTRALLEFYLSLTPDVTRSYRPFRTVSAEVIAAHLAETERGDHLGVGLAWNGGIVGHCFIMQLRRSHPVLGIGLAASLIGNGWGGQLMREVIGRADSLGIPRVTLTVLKDNARAIRLYRAFGFTVVRDYTFRDADDSHFMERLRPEAPGGGHRGAATANGGDDG